MKKPKIDRLRAAGWQVGSTKEFLGLSKEEIALIDLKLSLADLLREERLSQGLTQAALAKRIGSSQSRLAKLEAGRDATGGIAAGLDDLPLFASQQVEAPATDPLVEAIAAIDPDSLTPREALEALYALKRLASES